MTTVTLPKAEYDDLVKYKDAIIQRKTVVTRFHCSMALSSVETISILDDNETIKYLLHHIQDLNTKYQKIKNRTFFQRVFSYE